jgi:ribonuclease J
MSSKASKEIFASAQGRILIATFSTSIYRLQLLSDLAEQFDRKVAFVGAGCSTTRRSPSGWASSS